MLDDNLKAQLKAYLERLQKPVELVATLDDSATSRELRELLEDIRAQSGKITVVEKSDASVRTPSLLACCAISKALPPRRMMRWISSEIGITW